MPEITKEQWESRRQQMLARGIGLVLYNPVTDQSVDMQLAAGKFAKLPPRLQWEDYLLPALVQLGLVDA
jgi:hypothetical protein